MSRFYIFTIAVFPFFAVGCDWRVDHSNSTYTEVPVTHDDLSSYIGEPDEMRDIAKSRIFRRVVHRHYFEASGIAKIDMEPPRFSRLVCPHQRFSETV
jgi:hypothetical protein